RRPVQLLVGVLLGIGIWAAVLVPAERVINSLAGAHKQGPAEVAQTRPSKPVLATTPAAEAEISHQAALRLVIHYKHGVGATAAAKVEAGKGLHLVKSIPGLGLRVLTVQSAEQMSGVIAVLKGQPEIDSVERDGVALPQDNLPNDPSFPQSYAVGG